MIYFIGVCVAIIAFLVSVLICGLFYSWAVRRRLCLLVGFLAIFALGCGVYFIIPTDGSGGGNMDVLERSLFAINYSISSFFPSRGDYSLSESGIFGGWKLVLYWVFHFASTLYVMVVVVVLFGVELFNRFFVWMRLFLRKWLRRMGLKPEHLFAVNVFWGEDAELMAMAEAFSSRTRFSHGRDGVGSVVFVAAPRRWSFLKVKDDDSIAEISRRGWKWILGSSSNLGFLASAQRHFFMGPSGQQNVLDAERLIKELRSAGKGEKVKIYVRITASADDDVLFRWADRCNAENVGETRDIEVVVVREESLVARRFLVDHPMLEMPGIRIDRQKARVVGDFRILLLGFGTQGRILLNEMICNAQFLDENGMRVKTRVDVIDRSGESFGWCEANCQDACERFGIAFKRLDVGETEFWQFVKDAISRNKYNRIVVALHDDRQNVSVANELVRFYRSVGLDSNDVVFARVRDGNVRTYVETAFGCDNHACFRTFGDLADAYSSGVFPVDEWDVGAMKLNWKWYGDDRIAVDEAWRNVSFFAKESSRAAYMSLQNLRKLCDARYCGENLEVLAETEHLRWMAFLMMRGICPWRPSRDDIERLRESGEKVSPNAIDTLYAHAALVEYAELPQVDRLFGLAHPLQENDRNFVRALGEESE